MSNEDKAIDAIIAQAFEEAGQCEEMENRATEVLGCSTPSLATAVSLLAEAKRAAVPEGRLARLIGKAIDDAVKAKPTTYFQQWEATARENSRLEAERDEGRRAHEECHELATGIEDSPEDKALDAIIASAVLDVKVPETVEEMEAEAPNGLSPEDRAALELVERLRPTSAPTYYYQLWEATARENSRLEAELATERARREAAEAVVAKLPKTVDGVPIVPGIRLFPRADCELENEQGALVVEYAGIIIQDSVPSEYGNEELDVEEAGACFSTREAAQAALAPSPARQAELEARRDGLHVLNEFTKWHPDVEGIPCPIDTTEKHRAWLKKLAALCDRIAELETVLRRNAATFREIDDAAGRDATKMEAQKWKIQYLQDDLASARNQLDAVTKAKPPTHYYQQWQAAAELNSRLEAERDEARQALAQMDDNRKSALDTYTRCEYQLIECQQQLAAERARREAAEAVLERLPKTADGVPIVPGIRLFPRAEFELKNEDGGLVVGYAGVVIQDSVPSKYGNEELDVEEAEACFSTREAAHAALSPAPAQPAKSSAGKCKGCGHLLHAETSECPKCGSCGPRSGGPPPMAPSQPTPLTIPPADEEWLRKAAALEGDGITSVGGLAIRAGMVQCDRCGQLTANTGDPAAGIILCDACRAPAQPEPHTGESK